MGLHELLGHGSGKCSPGNSVASSLEDIINPLTSNASNPTIKTAKHMIQSLGQWAQLRGMPG